MLRKLSLLLCMLLLSACTLAPEQTPVPKTECPICPTPVTCPTCAAASACTPLPQPSAAQFTPIAITAAPLPTSTPVEPSPTATPLPTSTPVEPTPTAVPPTPAPMPFKIQEGTPAALQNFAHPDKACNWMGVAGQVIASDGSPVTRIVVLVTGTLNDQPVEFLGMTGSVLDYGLGGYEIELASKPVQTRGQLTLQLFDLDGIPLSDPVLFNTSKDCAKNLILINFTENQPR